MPSVEVYNIEGKSVGSEDLPDEIFGIEPSSDAIYYSVKAHLTNQRQGNASTKTRAEVRLSKRKMYRQKGTGRARMGTAASPIRIGGGVAHGPRPHAFQERVPKKVKRLAMKSAFSQKTIDGQLRVVEDFSLDEPKTKRMATLVVGLELNGKKALLLTESADSNLTKSCRNLSSLDVLPIGQMSVYDLVRSDSIVLTKGALSRLQTMWGTA